MNNVRVGLVTAWGECGMGYIAKNWIYTFDKYPNKIDYQIYSRAYPWLSPFRWHGPKIIDGPEQMEIPFSQRNNWRIMIDHKLLIETMDEEQQRSYGEYSQTPSSEEKRREKFEKKASTEAEEATWKLVKDSENPEDLIFFLKQYPNSPYAVPARLKLQQLERSSN